MQDLEVRKSCRIGVRQEESGRELTPDKLDGAVWPMAVIATTIATLQILYHVVRANSIPCLSGF